jgi:signal transduction histidine kinase
LLRIAHEAAANAARHAAAREIKVRLAYKPEVVELQVSDDGRGFDSSAPALRGHFGILGMQERANKLNATLTIESTAGFGTTIRVLAPAPSDFRTFSAHSP